MVDYSVKEVERIDSYVVIEIFIHSKNLYTTVSIKESVFENATQEMLNSIYDKQVDIAINGYPEVKSNDTMDSQSV